MNRSSGDYIGFGLLERFDCLAWAEWVSEHNPDHLPVYLCGVSMGASTVLMAADLDLPEDIHGIIADCGFTSPSAVWKHIATDNLHLPTGINSRMAELVFRRNLDMDWDAWTTVDALKHTSLPVLFIHGTDDHFVSVTMTYENCKACAGPHRLLVVPGADHGMSYFIAKEEYEQALKNFWQEYD